jgi:hypothetical protein
VFRFEEQIDWLNSRFAWPNEEVKVSGQPISTFEQWAPKVFIHEVSIAYGKRREAY